MKKVSKAGWIVVILILLPMLVCAQNRPNRSNRGMMNWSSDTPYVRMFDVNTIQTVTVTVEEVKTFTPKKGMSAGIHLVAKADDKTYDVHLGPSWFIENQEIEITKGDVLEITGSLIPYNDGEALIAKKITLENDEFVLRDDTGRPVWAGWRMGKGRVN